MEPAEQIHYLKQNYAALAMQLGSDNVRRLLAERYGAAERQAAWETISNSRLAVLNDDERWGNYFARGNLYVSELDGDNYDAYMGTETRRLEMWRQRQVAAPKDGDGMSGSMK